jgi:uncharacterized Zn-binding protein involved in type VI secretion
MAAVARLGDTSSHGGAIVTASTNVRANGQGVARQGDILQCPSHGPKALTAITTKTRVNGRLVITVGAHAACGAVITQGSPTVDAE